ncbi:MAG: hypothetical protein J5J06_15200 [Phycisphaerae bacterium]|nr:hypothetical protein [Phycisphaerae bacterium]
MDYVAVFKAIQERVNSGTEIEADIQRVLELCQHIQPHPDWARLRSLDYSDCSSIRAWLQSTLALDPPPLTLAGLWFGVETIVGGVRDDVDAQSAVSTEIFVKGAAHYDRIGIEWAASNDWCPRATARATVLTEASRIASSPGSLGSDAMYPINLAYTAFVVRNLLRDPLIAKAFRPAGNVGVVVGFSGGDYVELPPIPKLQ